MSAFSFLQISFSYFSECIESYLPVLSRLVRFRRSQAWDTAGNLGLAIQSAEGKQGLVRAERKI